jgi:hypothetical protein
MQHFALASIYPRSIAWLVRPDEWDRFETIVKYNCAMVGGYFNVVIPLVEDDIISDAYQQFLREYDPDLIVLAPDMTSDHLDWDSLHLHPFAVVPWHSLPKIADLDPYGGGSGMNVNVDVITPKRPGKIDGRARRVVVAVADNALPDTSRLALVACGDVEPREPMWLPIGAAPYLDSLGYREHLLGSLLKPEYSLLDAGAKAISGQHPNLAPAPDRS